MDTEAHCTTRGLGKDQEEDHVVGREGNEVEGGNKNLDPTKGENGTERKEEGKLDDETKGQEEEIDGGSQILDLTNCDEQMKEHEQNNENQRQYVCFRCAGSYGPEGHITEKDLADLKRSGSMINDDVVNGFLSILIRPNVERGVKRLDTTFYQSSFTSYRERDFYRENIDWRNLTDKIIFIPIFVGARTGGHYSLLVVDRIIHKEGIFVYFDSLSGYARNTWQKYLKMKACVTSTRRHHWEGQC